MMHRTGTGVVGIGLIALVGTGCAGGDGETPGVSTSARSDPVGGTATDASPTSGTTPAGFADPFLDEVARLDQPLDDAMTSFFDRLQTQYTNREAYLDALEGLDLAENFETVRDDARSLTPPREFEEAFDLWVANLEAAVDLARAFESELEGADVAAIAIPAAQLSADFESVLIEITARSPELCRALTTGAPAVGDDHDAFATRACVVRDDLPGGDYGQQANLVARETAATVFPLISAAPLSLMEDDEEVRYLSAIQPIVEAEFERAHDRLSDLTPPADLEDDHAAVLTYLRDIADVARRITEAAEAGDQAALTPLYDESGRPGRALSQALSDDGRMVFGAFVIPDG